MPARASNVEADRIAFDAKSKIATATGTVRITYGPYTLVATKVVYNEATDDFKANGSVELREPNGNILQAETADLHNKFKEGFAKHVRALLTNDVTITAEYATRQEGGITIYEHASYTACKDCTANGGAPLWEITTTKTVHDEKAKNLYHTNPTLRFGGVPVAWLPYADDAGPHCHAAQRISAAELFIAAILTASGSPRPTSWNSAAAPMLLSVHGGPRSKAPWPMWNFASA